MDRISWRNATRILASSADSGSSRRSTCGSIPNAPPPPTRLAAARRAKERHELAALGREVEVAHGERFADLLLDAGQLQECGHRFGVLVLSARAGDLDAGARAAPQDREEAHRDPRQAEADECDGGRLVGLVAANEREVRPERRAG